MLRKLNQRKYLYLKSVHTHIFIYIYLQSRHTRSTLYQRNFDKFYAKLSDNVWFFVIKMMVVNPVENNTEDSKLNLASGEVIPVIAVICTVNLLDGE